MVEVWPAVAVVRVAADANSVAVVVVTVGWETVNPVGIIVARIEDTTFTKPDRIVYLDAGISSSQTHAHDCSLSASFH